MIRQLIQFRKSDRGWQLPVLAGCCIGVPIIAGAATGYFAEGKLASLAGLVILYIHDRDVASRMITLMTCSFGLMVSFTVGLLFSFNLWLAPLFLGIFAFLVHTALFYLDLRRPPGNFFFIMIASIGICQPFDLSAVPHKIGLIGIGTMVSCLLGLVYSLAYSRRNTTPDPTPYQQDRYINLVESMIFGVFVGIALLVARLLELENPYWAPASCVAVMQGSSSRQIWQRSIQRVIGTWIGLMASWALLTLKPSLIAVCVAIIGLQIIVEFLVVRNYAVAVIFITILTILLAESGTSLLNPDALLRARFLDIATGSAIGAIGGWMLFNEKFRFNARRHIRRTKVMMTRRR